MKRQAIFIQQRSNQTAFLQKRCANKTIPVISNIDTKTASIIDHCNTTKRYTMITTLIPPHIAMNSIRREAQWNREPQNRPKIRSALYKHPTKSKANK